MPQTHHHRSRRIIKSFEAQARKNRPISVKIADALTSSFGTMAFLLVNLLIFIVWIVINSGKGLIQPFDPFPFLLLSVMVSTYAIILSIVVLISQNRESQISNLRNEFQLQVNLITEKEITKILQLLKKSLAKQGIKIEDEELEEMIREIDTSYIERKLEEQLDNPESLTQALSKPIEKFEKEVERSFASKK